LFGALWPAEQYLYRNTDVLCDLAKENRRNVLAFVEWNRGGTSIGMSELLMRTSLTCLKEAGSLQMANNLLWFQNRQTAHGLCDCHLLSAYKLGFKMRLAVIEKQ